MPSAPYPAADHTATADRAGGSPAVIAIVGAGPKGIGVLERLCASAPGLLGGRRLLVHLVDPFTPGPGRVWRYEQSPLLLMNSKAQDVTMFTDETVSCEGPARPGPTLAEWAELVRDGALAADVPAPLCPELRQGTPVSFHSRRLNSAYLRWFYQWVIDTRPETVDVRVHATEAVDLTEEPDGGQLLWLDGRLRPLRADVVILSVGHLDVGVNGTGRRLTGFARRHGLKYFPPAYTADVDWSVIEPGEIVLVRGFGLAFMDLLALLTEGRGGRFAPGPDGVLTYHPSGEEPRLHVGSRRGVPYRPKPGFTALGVPAELPRFFGPAEVERLAARPGPIRFWADLWPLMAKEIGWGYYTELFTGHPDRVTMPFEKFADRYAVLGWEDDELRDLVAEAVPAAGDRLDLTRLDRPLSGLTTVTAGEMAGHVRQYVEMVLDRCRDPVYSADLGTVAAMLSVFRQMPGVVATGKLDASSQVIDVDGWWFGFFSSLGSGPPAPRLHELLALESAGIVSFAGPDLWVEADEGHAVFRGGSRHTPDVVTATTLVEARLPQPDVAHSTNPLIRVLHDSGRLGEETLTDGEETRPTGRIHTSGIGGRLYDASGVQHPRRFAMGPHTTLRVAGAFSRPRTNALGFRENDLVARQALRIAGRRVPDE